MGSHSHFTNMSADGVTMTKKDMLPEKLTWNFALHSTAMIFTIFARQYEQMTNIVPISSPTRMARRRVNCPERVCVLQAQY